MNFWVELACFIGGALFVSIIVTAYSAGKNAMWELMQAQVTPSDKEDHE